MNMVNKCFIFILVAVFYGVSYSCGNRSDYYHNEYYCDLKDRIEQDLDASAFEELEVNVYYDNSKEEYKDAIKYARIIADKKEPLYGESVFDLYEMAGMLSNPLYLDTALFYLKKSALAGNQFAAYKLKRIYQDGEYVKVNIDSASYYLNLALDLQSRDDTSFTLGVE